MKFSIRNIFLFNIILIVAFLLFVGFMQKPAGKKASIIEQYSWKGACDPPHYCYKLTLDIYSDSTYVIDPFECRKYYKDLPDWPARKTHKVYGNWTLRNGKRIFMQMGNELKMIVQGDGFVMYEKIKLIKK